MLGKHDVKKSICRDRIHTIFYKIQNTQNTQNEKFCIIFMLGKDDEKRTICRDENIFKTTFTKSERQSCLKSTNKK